MISQAMERADPTAMGLTGFSSVVLLVSAHHAGLLEGTAWRGPMAILAGVTLLSASHHNLRLRGAALSANNFGVFGAFWLAVGTWDMLGHTPLGDEELTVMRVPVAMYVALAWAAAAQVSRVALMLFTLLEAQLACLIAGHAAGSTHVSVAGGWCGIACACVGFYAAATSLLTAVRPRALQIASSQTIQASLDPPPLPVSVPASEHV